MRPFQFTRAGDAKAAVAAYGAAGGRTGAPDAASQYLAGGTTLLDLMKLDVMRPTQVIDINALQADRLADIEFGAGGLRLGAMVRMAKAADHPDVVKNFPMVAQALSLGASAQIR